MSPPRPPHPPACPPDAGFGAPRPADPRAALWRSAVLHAALSHATAVRATAVRAASWQAPVARLQLPLALRTRDGRPLPEPAPPAPIDAAPFGEPLPVVPAVDGAQLALFAC